MAIASLDEVERSLTWLSIGNVAGVLLRASSQGAVDREHIMMRGGVVGQRLPSLRTTTLSLRKGDIFMFATDGVRNGFYDDGQFSRGVAGNRRSHTPQVRKGNRRRIGISWTLEWSARDG